MKKRLTIAIIFLLLLVFAVPVSANDSTTYNYTISLDGDWKRTQFAYTPGGAILKTVDLSNPEDLFWHEDCLYIADTGNKRIVVYDLSENKYTTFGEGVLQKPRGIFVKKDGAVYVADAQAEAVFLFDKNRKLIQTIGRPESPPFGTGNPYVPKNVVLSSAGNIFVVGDGCSEGLMQFDESGHFYGFFAANKRDLTLLERIQSLIYTEEQKDQLLMRTAPSIYNIDISERDLIFSVTQSAEYSYSWRAAEDKTDNNLKEHNMAGKNILSPDKFMDDEWNFVDVAAGPYNNTYALTESGLIYEYDSSGNLVFSFGGRAVSSDRNGLFTKASAIDVDNDGVIYILDSERSLVQLFYPSEFAAVTHQAIAALESGAYRQSEEIWERLLDLDGTSRIAHSGYGNSLYHQQRFAEAMEHFKLVGDKEFYSEAMWELRNKWLNDNMLYILIAVLVVAGFFFVRGKLRVRCPVPAAPKAEKKSSPKLWMDITYSRNMLRHPIDSYYDLKHGHHGSVLSATVLFVLLFIVYMSDRLLNSFLFRELAPENAPIFTYILLFVGGVVLWVIGNYMISAINDGEGSLSNIYVMTAYALTPYLIITPVKILLSYGLALNEGFIIQILSILGIVWSAVNLFVGVTEIHAYTVRETIKNILLTLFFILIAIIVIAMMTMIWSRVITFFEQIWGEAWFNVKN